MTDPDIINTLAGLTPDSRLALTRDRKPVTRENAQASFRALFEPAEPGTFAFHERFAIASFVAELHSQDDIKAFYTAGLRRAVPAEEFVAALSAEADRGRTVGPYGAYPKGPLTVEDLPGPIYQVAEANRSMLGTRLSAALAHVHMLVFHPRDASPASLQALHDAGWSKADIVTLSQLVAFLAFQIRAIAGLRALAGAGV
jgi:CMD domain protein